MICKKFKEILVKVLVFCILLSCLGITPISVFAETTPAPTGTPASNQPPVAENLSINTIINTPFNGTLTATDPEGNPMVYEIVYQPQKGTVNITNTATGAFTYTPNTDITGDDSFQFKTNDGTQDSNIATVSVTISPAASPTPTPTATPTAEPVGFVYQDLINHWAQYSASKLAERNIIIGEKIGEKYYFYPDKIMNRAEFTLFLTAALGLDTDTLGNEAVGFADESSIPSWALKEARAAKKANLISGSQDNGALYYNPYGVLNRVETITILHNALNPEVSSNIPFDFADSASVPLWAVQTIKDMEGYGLVKGYEDNTIRPFQQVTRAEAAEMLYQLIKYKESHT